MDTCFEFIFQTSVDLDETVNSFIPIRANLFYHLKVQGGVFRDHDLRNH